MSCNLYVVNLSICLGSSLQMGETPLVIASYKGRVDVVDILCRNGADVNTLCIRYGGVSGKSICYFIILNGE